MFLRNVGVYLRIRMASQPGRVTAIIMSQRSLQSAQILVCQATRCVLLFRVLRELRGLMVGAGQNPNPTGPVLAVVWWRSPWTPDGRVWWQTPEQLGWPASIVASCTADATATWIRSHRKSHVSPNDLVLNICSYFLVFWRGEGIYILCEGIKIPTKVNVVFI